jgi:YHS domain-containing protein
MPALSAISRARRPRLGLAAVLLGAAVTFGTVSLMPGSAHAKEPQVFTGIVKGVAVGGYDPVAYFTEKKPVPGKAEFTHEHEGAVWRFSSAANRDAFKAAPAKYAPQYGGYCAWAVSQGYTAKGDPTVWSVTDGKLFLNYNAGVQKGWERDVPNLIKKADANWPVVLDKK